MPPGRPVRLVEMGASAGLNLLLDRFSYRYNDAAPIPGTVADAGDRALRRRGRTGEAAVASEPRVVCARRVCGRLPALGAPPAIAERIGIDLHPVDLEDPGTARWLLACVWPDQPDRIRSPARRDRARPQRSPDCRAR